MKIEDKVLRYIREHSIIKKGDRVLVALSGGPDSVCLFHVLRVLQNRLKFNIYAGHFDHGLRADSEKDRLFCKRLCAKYRVPFLSEKGHLKRDASEGISRQARYDFLKMAAEHFSCHSVATGHQQDDQAETVLLHLLRGTGIQGLSGIRPSRPLSAKSRIMLVRPLLPVSRAEIIEFLKEKGHNYVVDASNVEKRYQRNRIRLQILPLLERFNPRIREVLFRLAEILSADYQYISDQAAAFLKTHPVKTLPEHCKARKRLESVKGYQFSSGEFETAPLSLQREILRQGVSRLCKTEYRADYNETEHLRRFFLSGKGKRVTLSGKITAFREKSSLCLTGPVRSRGC